MIPENEFMRNWPFPHCLLRIFMVGLPQAAPKNPAPVRRHYAVLCFLFCAHVLCSEQAQFELFYNEKGSHRLGILGLPGHPCPLVSWFFLPEYFRNSVFGFILSVFRGGKWANAEVWHTWGVDGSPDVNPETQ